MTSCREYGRITVLIVDDHDIVAFGLRALLDEADDVEVIDCVTSAGAALATAEARKPQVVFMDYRLPDGTGADAARRMRRLSPAPEVVMLTSVSDRHVLAQAIDAGCCGFVSKNADREDLLAAARAAASGSSYFSSDMLTHLVHVKRFDEVEGGDLSGREIEVLQLTAEGLTPEGIAAQLYLSPHTIKNHLRHAMAKLDSHTKLDAVVKALRARLISID